MSVVRITERPPIRSTGALDPVVLTVHLNRANIGSLVKAGFLAESEKHDKQAISKALVRAAFAGIKAEGGK